MIPNKIYISEGYNNFNSKLNSLIATKERQFKDDEEYVNLKRIWSKNKIPENLQNGDFILCKCIDGFKICNINEWDDFKSKNNIIEWAYINDLI